MSVLTDLKSRVTGLARSEKARGHSRSRRPGPLGKAAAKVADKLQGPLRVLSS